jgi:hypothetical protein
MGRKQLSASLLLVTTLWAPRALARSAAEVEEEIGKDPLWQKYYPGGGGPSNAPTLFKVANLREEFKFTHDIGSQCNIDLHQCQWGWDSFLGKPDPVLAQWLIDVLAFALWQDEGSSGGDRYGLRYMSKVSNDGNALPRSAIALGWVKQEGAADAIAKTLAVPREIDDLYGAGCTAGYAVRGIWLQGADGKKQLPVLLKALEHNTKGRLSSSSCRREHLAAMLPHLDTWTLSPDEVKQMETLCLTVFQEDIGSALPKAACLRYMGAISSTHSEVRDFIANFAQGNDNFLRVEGIRAAARIGHPDVETFLSGRLAKNYSKVKKSVEKGKKKVDVEVEQWNTNFDAVQAAVALFGLGDATAGKAIAYWVSFEERGGKPNLANNKALNELCREAPFMSPKTLAKLQPMLVKAFETAQKGLATNPQLEYDVFKVALGLSHVGDKGALKYLTAVMNGADDSRTKELLWAWGGEPDKLLEGGRSTIGLGRFPMSKGRYTPADGEAIIALVKKRLKFWNDGEMKQDGIEMAIAIQAGIEAAKNGL